MCMCVIILYSNNMCYSYRNRSIAGRCETGEHIGYSVFQKLALFWTSQHTIKNFTKLINLEKRLHYCNAVIGKL